MRCHKHWNGLHARLKVEATQGEYPGQWNCVACHPLVSKLHEFGHLEYSDKRATPPYRPIPRLTPQEILACLNKQRDALAELKRTRASLLGAGHVAPADNEEDLDVAPGQSPGDAPTVGAGTPSASVALEPAEAEKAPKPKPKPEPKRVVLDASAVDLDDPSSWGAAPKPRAKPKPKAKKPPAQAKPRAKKAPPQSEGLF